MNCPSCNAKTYADDQNYCGHCGWRLDKTVVGKIEDIITYPEFCPYCNAEVHGSIDEPFCAQCGEYLPSNREKLDPRLIEIAKIWEERPVDFFKKVLGLSNKVANALQRCGVTPAFALCMGSDEFLEIKHLGETCFREFYNARYNWKPIQEKGE